MTTRRTSDSREPREREALHDEAPATTTGSWDPYDVWLTRVKEPRDQTRRLRKLEPRPDAQPSDEPEEPRDPDASPKPSPA